MKNKKGFLLGILVGLLLCGTTVYATSYLAKDITYKDTTVEEALNELYSNKNNDLVSLMIYNKGQIAYSSSTKAYASVSTFEEKYGTYEDKKITITEKGKYRIFVIPVWSPLNEAYTGTANLIVNGSTLKTSKCDWMSTNYIDTIIEVEEATTIEGYIGINGNNISGTLAMYLFVYKVG